MKECLVKQEFRYSYWRGWRILWPEHWPTSKQAQSSVVLSDWAVGRLPKTNNTIGRDRSPTLNTLNSVILHRKHRLTCLNIWLLTGGDVPGKLENLQEIVSLKEVGHCGCALWFYRSPYFLSTLLPNYLCNMASCLLLLLSHPYHHGGLSPLLNPFLPKVVWLMYFVTTKEKSN